MNVLQLKFSLILEAFSHAPKYFQIYGPLFHRWLPDGEKDAISLDTGDPNAKLKVWFERRGFVEGGFIQFDYGRKEVDAELMSRQALLQGGSLYGLLIIKGLSDDEIAAVREDKQGNEAYVGLGKRVAKKLLQPAVSKFLQLLKTNYGQYWIPDLHSWDSRKESLGGYFAGGFAGLFVSWSIDGEKWEDFRPDMPAVTSTVSLGKDFSNYPSKVDWQELKEAAESKYEPTLSALALARAHQFKDQGNIRHAVVEGVTALEIALSDFLRERVQQETELINHMQSFYNLPLKTQLLTLAVSNSKVSMADVKDAIQVIDVRNDIMHEGKAPSPSDEARIPALFRTVAAFLGGPRFRFPRLITSENLMLGPKEDNQN